MILIDCPAVKSSSHISAHCGECETWHIIAREERSGFQGALLATTHAYDDLDRLAADGGVAYTYDEAGNRMTRTENGETVTYALGAGDRLASWTGGSYTYNAAGCVTRIERDGRPTLDLAWNGQYQLVSVSTNGVFAEGYAYDALGRRVSTTTQEGTVRHIYDDSWQCLADIDENGNVLRSYVWGEGIDKLLAVKIGGESYYPLTDIQGTVWGYADSQNNVVARWTYDAWGNVLSEFCAVPALASVRYRFQGRERSAVTGLINFRMRWYDAVTGRWLSRDPTGLNGGLNLYVFCGGDSINNTDVHGTFFLPLVLNPFVIAGATALAIVTANAVVNLFNNVFQRRGPSRRPGERNWAGRPDGTPNPDKHVKMKGGRLGRVDQNGRWKPSNRKNPNSRSIVIPFDNDDDDDDEKKN